MRITGGKLTGYTTTCPDGKMAIRPAMDRMRESLFSIIEPELQGKSFLDLFSGSGTIAIEAASRGASKVTLCEMDKAKARTVFENVSVTEKELGLKIECHFIAVELFLKRLKESYDFIFFDPPFPYKYRQELVETVSRKTLLNQGGTVLIHHPKEDPLPEKIGDLIRYDQRVYGRSIVDFFTTESTEKTPADEKKQNENLTTDKNMLS